MFPRYFPSSVIPSQCALRYSLRLRLTLQRQPYRHHRAAALGVLDGQRAAVAADDLVADRQPDAAAPCFGRAFVELLLHVGQLRLRDARAEIPDGDGVAVPRPGQMHGDALA